MEKPTPTTQNITLTITHPEKERFELCEIECGAATTLEDLKEQICAKTGLQARILVMAKRYEADGDLDERSGPRCGPRPTSTGCPRNRATPLEAWVIGTATSARLLI